MQETLDALREIPCVISVEFLDKENNNTGISLQQLRGLLSNKSRLTLIGSDGCAVFFENKSSIFLVRTEANVNFGAIDLLIDSLKKRA